MSLCWGWARVDASGPSAAGHRAAADALAQLDPALRLAHDGTRPVVVGGEGCVISVSHGRDLAVAVVASIARLGVDLCEYDRGPQIRGCATRFFTASECTLLIDDRAAAAMWAAKEAGLKALGLGIYDAGFLDDPALCPVRIESHAPPRYASPSRLTLELEERDDAVIAIAYSDEPSSRARV